MKIRIGFVSNSSSSSFVIAFPHKPKDVADVNKILFGKQEWHYTRLSYGDEESDVSTQTLAENVFKKIKKKATKQEILDSIQNGWFDEYFSLPGHNDTAWDSPEYKALNRSDKDYEKKRDALWEKFSKEDEKRAAAIAEAFRRVNKDKYIVVMEFSDNEDEAVEEHSDIFRRIEHIRTSYH